MGTPANKRNYKKEYADYWKEILGLEGDFTLKEETEIDNEQ